MKRAYEGATVLVTGSDGFIGSHLVERLVAEGANVRAFCLYNSNGSYGWLDGIDRAVSDRIDYRLGDVRDARFVSEATRGVSVVFHLAALIAIPYSYDAPESFIDTNVKGTLNILEAARVHGTKRVVVTSTSEVYGTPDEVPIRETHPLKGQSPYSASKIAADKMSEAYFCSFGVPVVTLRPFNTYGPRQSTRAVLPTILTQLLAGQTEIKLGSLAPKRDLTFVLDTVDGFVRAGHVAGIEGETIQLGTGHAVSVGELFDAACAALGKKARVITEEARLRPDKSEVQVLLSDPAKAARLLDWKPQTSLADGLRQSAEWLKSNLERFRVDRYHR